MTGVCTPKANAEVVRLVWHPCEEPETWQGMITGVELVTLAKVRGYNTQRLRDCPNNISPAAD